MRKEGDPYLALLPYRATPIQNGFSPSELLMSGKLRTTVPITQEQLRAHVPDSDSLRETRKSRVDSRVTSTVTMVLKNCLSPLIPGQTDSLDARSRAKGTSDPRSSHSIL